MDYEEYIAWFNDRWENAEFRVFSIWPDLEDEEIKKLCHELDNDFDRMGIVYIDGDCVGSPETQLYQVSEAKSENPDLIVVMLNDELTTEDARVMCFYVKRADIPIVFYKSSVRSEEVTYDYSKAKVVESRAELLELIAEMMG